MPGALPYLASAAALGAAAGVVFALAWRRAFPPGGQGRFWASLSAVGHLPVAGLALILGIDRFMSEARALTNLIGNGVATLVVAKWCKQLDEDTLQRELASGGKRLEEPVAAPQATA